MNINDIMKLNSVLDGFLTLPTGWDSYKGAPINKNVISKAKEIACLLPGSGWQAVPCSPGAVQIEKHDDEFSIEIYIESRL